MSRPDSDRNLLFGMLALQMDLLTRDALIAGMNAWLLEKGRPLGDLLVERGDLDPLDRALLDPMIDRHVARHGGDPLASLAAISSLGEVAADLRRSVAADPDLLASLDSVPGTRSEDPFATRAEAPPGPPSPAVRFRKVREHAAGNLGVVYVARDEELNREVALKEIKEKNADHAHSQAKFLLEAEVTGGLEHPGIVPVYGLGHHLDGRPFYAMRFIRGKSLLEAIKRFHADDPLKDDPGRRLLALQKLLRRFTDVCNAVAYAHSRGILHRDLKPDNVMVGKYGETLVVDWGLAKAMGHPGETFDDPDDPLPEASLQPSSGDGLDATQAGSLVGTPAYMSPEQAAGRLDLLGPASDIYGLGATLYHLIVGRVSIEARTLGELLAKIQAGEIPRPRSLAPWLDPALEAICLKAMALKPEARYASPRALAEDLDRWIAGEPVAAYPEPLARRARRWAKKHRTTLATIASAATVAVLLLGAVAWSRSAFRRQADAFARETFGQAEGLAIKARATGDLADWSNAIAEAVRAYDRLETGDGSPVLRQVVGDRLEALLAERNSRREELDVLKKDRRVVDDLEEARLRQSATGKDQRFDARAKHEAYLAAFRAYGIDVGRLPVEDAARRIRSSKVVDELIAALDDWAVEDVNFFGGDHPATNVPVDRLGAIARAAETDPLRVAIRDAVARRDATALRGLCGREEDRRKLGPRLRSVFAALVRLDPAGSLPMLEAIRREKPSDLWLNHSLGDAYGASEPIQFPEMLRCLSVAVALRPDSPGVHITLGHALAAKGDFEGAIAEHRIAIRIKPEDANSHCDFAMTLMAKGDFEGAIEELRAAIRLEPNLGDAYHYLGLALMTRLDVAGAIDAFRAEIRINPDNDEAHFNLGIVLKLKGDLDGAIAEHRAVIRLNPDFDAAHNNLGIALAAKGDLDGAIAEYRIAIRINPEDPKTHNNLGLALRFRLDLDGAIAEFRAAIRINPEDAEAHNNLGAALASKGDLDGAIAEFRTVVRIKPDDGNARFNLEASLKAKAAPAEAPWPAEAAPPAPLPPGRPPSSGSP